LLPIIIITRETGCPPALALTMEGLEVAELVMRDYTHYGRVFMQQWQSGNGFIVVEEDIVPWPGAIKELQVCPEDWCAFEFPNGIILDNPRQGFCWSLGCMKFSTDLVKRYEASQEWQFRGWDELDGSVIGMLPAETCHLHLPPVAHAKAQVLVSRRGVLPREAMSL
jgi:hypothetical protein